MAMLGLNVTLDKLAMACSVCWYWVVLEMGRVDVSCDGHHILRLKVKARMKAKNDMEEVC